MENKTEEQTTHDILSISSTGGNYNIAIGAGCSWAEVAFAINAVARILEREKVVTAKEFVDKIRDYTTDSLYDETFEQVEPVDEEDVPLPEVEDLDNDVLAERDDD